MSTWLIRACSTGLGRALAEAVVNAVHHVVVTARNVSSLQGLVETAPDGFSPCNWM